MDTEAGATSRFAISDGYAVYRGPTTTGTLHRHAAFQVVIGVRDPVAVVAPMARHSLLAHRWC